MFEAELQALASNYAELDRFVRAEPRLSMFCSATNLLAEQARELSNGARDIKQVPKEYCGLKIPDRDLAEGILRIVRQGPPFFPTEESVGSGLLRACAQLEGNFCSVFMRSVFRDYPELVPREVPDSPEVGPSTDDS